MGRVGSRFVVQDRFALTEVGRTSIFPDGKRGTYVLPIKEAVRRAEGLAPGVTAKVRIVLVDL